MPQGRRKVPFSGKAKKLQLQVKRGEQKLPREVRHTGRVGPHSALLKNGTDSDSEVEQDIVQKLNHQPSSGQRKRNPNRFLLQFHQESPSELQKLKEGACKPLTYVLESDLEIDSANFYVPGLDMPMRPPWSFEMTREQLEAKEHHYFMEYITTIEKKFSWKDLSYFELNLETWRQLWRVLEMSDIILVIVDIRFPNLLFPPSLYNYVSTTLNKQMILVLNKVDLAPASLVVAWKHYFEEKYPELLVLIFTSFPAYNLLKNQIDKKGLQLRQSRGKMRMAAEGAQKLVDACKLLVKDQVDLTSWQKKISEEMEVNNDIMEELEVAEIVEVKKVDTSFFVHEKYKNGILTIGFVGQPNAGKSSLMNAIMGKKVVSVSKTPGHTKHFQTIYLTPNVRLCDCPGLVFPSKVPKTLQILMGSFPIAQLREPFSVVQFLAERIDLPRLLKLQHPEGDTDWSAMDLCEGWALKRGFRTARAARLDSNRAANLILRMALEGRICLCLRPPGYCSKKDYWENHKDIEMVNWIQAQMKSEAGRDVVDTDTSEDSPEEEEVDVLEIVEASLSDLNVNSINGDDSESNIVSQFIFQNKFSALEDPTI